MLKPTQRTESDFHTDLFKDYINIKLLLAFLLVALLAITAFGYLSYNTDEPIISIAGSMYYFALFAIGFALLLSFIFSKSILKQRREAVDLLQRNEFIVNSVDFMMSLINRSYCYEAVNKTWLEMMNYSGPEVLGKPIGAFWSEGVFEREIKPLVDSCMAGREIHKELWLHLPAKGRRFCSIDYFPYRNASGEITYVVVLTRDITVRKQQQEELARAKEAAEAANLAKSRFLANMSHEIRTPMNAILGYSQLLQRDPTLRPDQVEKVLIINRSGDHLLNLINDILEISKIEAGFIALNPEPFDLKLLIDDVDSMFRLRTEDKDLALYVKSAPDLPRYINADRGKIRQVLINLLSNAIKFTQAGSITGWTSKMKSTQQAHLISIEIEDTGVGIDPSEQKKLFEAFEQTASGIHSGEGSGLGLSISRAYARSMGGDLRLLKSTPGQGAVFRFTFQAEPAKAEDIQSRTEYNQVIGLHPEQKILDVLVVEDDEHNRILLRDMLSGIGFKVTAVSSGEEAIIRFESTRPDLVLTDIRMPGIDGFETTRRLRAMPGGREAKIIIITAAGLNPEEIEKTARAHGADAYLAKPFKSSDILDKIGQLTDVVYVHADEKPVIDLDISTTVMTRVLPQKLDRLSEDFKVKLRETVEMGDMETFKDHIAGIEDIDEQTRRYLLNLAGNFDYIKLLKILD